MARRLQVAPFQPRLHTQAPEGLQLPSEHAAAPPTTHRRKAHDGIGNAIGRDALLSGATTSSAANSYAPNGYGFK
eukprot:5955181-Prymnesium_polylepis.1